MPWNSRFHDGGTYALPFIIDDQAKAAGGIIDADTNVAMGMLQCVSQGLSSNLNDLFADAGAH
jgi:hypothetical protein